MLQISFFFVSAQKAARNLRNGYPARPTNTGLPYGVFVPKKNREQGRSSVHRQPSGFAYELRDEYHTKPHVVVAIVGVVVVAVSHAAVLGVVVPTAAAQHAIRTHDERPFFPQHIYQKT